VPNTALAVVTELFRDWASPLAEKAREVIYWYFGEVTKLKADVGVSEVEKQAAGVGSTPDVRQAGQTRGELPGKLSQARACLRRTWGDCP
jgi:hypothetical protein